MTTYRHDLAERTRALLNKISSRQKLLQQLDKQVSDALHDAARLDYYAPDLGPLNDRRMSAMDEIRHARREMEAIREEKRKLLADADVSDPHIGVDELPTTQSEFQIRLHGVREPERSALMRKMIHIGLVEPYQSVAAE